MLIKGLQAKILLIGSSLLATAGAVSSHSNSIVNQVLDANSKTALAQQFSLFDIDDDNEDDDWLSDLEDGTMNEAAVKDYVRKTRKEQIKQEQRRTNR